MSESASEAVGTAPTSSRRGGVLGLFKRGEAKENTAAQNAAAVRPAAKPAQAPRHGLGLLSPLAHKRATGASHAAVPMGPASALLSAGGWAMKTAPQPLLQHPTSTTQADMSKTMRPEQRRALVEKKKQLLSFKVSYHSLHALMSTTPTKTNIVDNFNRQCCKPSWHR